MSIQPKPPTEPDREPDTERNLLLPLDTDLPHPSHWPVPEQPLLDPEGLKASTWALRITLNELERSLRRPPRRIMRAGMP
jgi:hypothetical protein